MQTGKANVVPTMWINPLTSRNTLSRWTLQPFANVRGRLM
jgi:hypothetical protein